MESRTEHDNTVVVVVVLLVVVVLVLAVVGGVGFLFVMRQRSAVVAQMEAARAAEMMAAHAAAEGARLQAEHARAQADASRTQETNAPLQPDAERLATNAIEEPDNPTDAQAAIGAMLTAQQQAWNDGNIEQFMEPYWPSENLTFSSGGRTTRGWKATLERYRAKYPDRKTMGKLSFEVAEITLLGPAAGLVLGTWHIERETNAVGGNFSLVVRQLDGNWRIIHDHTSQLAE